MATNNSDAASEPPASATAPGAPDVIAPRPVKRKASDPCDGVSCSPGGWDFGGCGCGDHGRAE